MKTCFAAFLFLGLVSSAMPALGASSLILSDQPGWNGFAIQTKVQAGFHRAGDALGPSRASTDVDNDFVNPFSVSPGDFIVSSASVSGVPLDAGAFKDAAEGFVSFQYNVGSSTTLDSFSFFFNTKTSATAAQIDFGGGLENVDAFAQIDITLTIFGPVTGAILTLPSLPSLTASAPTTESMLALVNGPIVGFMLPGDPALDFPVDLTGIQFFEYHFSYTVTTPFGADPITSYNITGGGAGVVPEPGVSLLAALSGLVLLRRRRC